MVIEGGFFVHTARLDDIATAAAQVADGVMAVADGVANVSTTPPDRYGDWLLGDTSIDLVISWDDVLHALADEVRTLGRSVGKASKLYSAHDAEFGAIFRNILS